MKKIFSLLLAILIFICSLGVFSACNGLDFDGNDGDNNTDISGDNGDETPDDGNGGNDTPDDGGNSGSDTPSNPDDGGNTPSNPDDGGDSGNETPSNPGDDTGDTPSVQQTVTLDRVTYSLLSDNTYAVTTTSLISSDLEVTIPQTIEGITVTKIDVDAFRGKKNVKKVVLPDTITEIGNSAFNGCSALLNINLGKIQKIGNNAFTGSIIFSADLSSVTSIGKGAFSGTRVQSITIPNGITQILPDTFANCSFLSSVTLPQSVLEIRDSAFKNCSALSSINLENVELIDFSAFESCASLKQVTLTNVIYIKDLAFASTGLTNVTIGNECIQIYLDTFTACSYLQTIDLGSAHTKTWYILLVFGPGTTGKYAESPSYPIVWREKLKDPTLCRDFLSIQNHLEDSYIATTEWFDSQEA
ncbi:MAG: leucine-rich repeat protein [Clostridia bacterium]|nr:leucine-rich repeat protein [Clostridia bacterium]